MEKEYQRYMNEILTGILFIVATLGVGALTAYFRTNTKLQSKVGKFIADAEEAWKSTTKSGGQKFEWIVD